MNTAISQKLSEFVVGTKLEDIPKVAIDFSKMLLLKTIAGIIAGSKFPASRKMVDFIHEHEQTPEVGIFGHRFKASTWAAVLAHTVFAHASELEDDRFGAHGGTSWDITVIPVTCAIAGKRGLSGKALLEASIVGLEVHCRTCTFPTEHLGLQLVPGGVGPAAGAARALGLDIEQTASALGLAMSVAPVASLNFGTDAHYFESGMQSLHGLMAAEAASVGMTGNPEIGRYLRYLLGKDKVNPEEIVESLGREWRFQDICIKKYPCCFGAHRQIDSILELINEQALSWKDIKKVDVHISRADRVLDRPEPKTIGDLQFSFQHVLAAAMVDRDVNLTHFAADRIDDTKLATARQRVTVIVHDDWPTGTLEAPSLIVVNLKDGRQIVKERKYPIGSSQQPLNKEQLISLYRKFMQGILTEKQIKRTMDEILNLEELSDIGALIEMLTFDVGQ